MWISKVEDISASESQDAVQLDGEMGKQNYIRSMMGRRPMRTINLAELTRESAAFVTFSRVSVQQSSVTKSAALSGVDVNLFAAD